MGLNLFYNGGSDESLLKSLEGDSVHADQEELMKAMDRTGLVQKEVQYKTKSGKIATRKQWVRASEDHTNQKPAGNSEENTMENRNKLKAEIDNYVKNHPNPTEKDRKKVSEMRDKYQKMKDEAYKKPVEKQNDSLKNDKSDKTTNSESKKSEQSSDESFIQNKFNHAYAGNSSIIKNTEKIKVGDKVGYVVTREVIYDGGDHSFTGTVYSAVFDNKALEVSDTEDNSLTPINLEDGTAFRRYEDCISSLKQVMKSNRNSTTKNNTLDETKDEKTQKELKGGHTDEIKDKSSFKTPSSTGKEDVSKEVISVRDSIDDSGTATTTSKEIADMYRNNKNSNRNFSVKDNKDGSYTITSSDSNRSDDTSQSSFKTPSSKQDLVKLLQSGATRDDIMAQAEKDGITWKKSDNAGINWMRCSMAITKTSTRGSKKEDAKQQKKSEDKKSETKRSSSVKLESGAIDKQGDLIVSDKSNLSDLVEEITGKDMFDFRDSALDEVEKKVKSYAHLDEYRIESMSIDSAKVIGENIRITAGVDVRLHYKTDDGSGDDDAEDMTVSFEIPLKRSIYQKLNS